MVDGLTPMQREEDASARHARRPPAPPPSSVVLIVARAPAAAEEADRLAARLPADTAAVLLLPSGDDAAGRLAAGSRHRVAAARGATFEEEAVVPAAENAGGAAVERTLLALAETFDDRAVAVVLGALTEAEERALAAVHTAGGLALASRDGEVFAAPGAAGEGPERTIAGDRIAAAVADAVPRGDVLRLIGPRLVDEVVARLVPIGGPGVRHFKPALIARRVGRRIVLTGAAGPAEYLARLAADEAEARALHADLLIGVTRFFRDGPVWDTLGRDVLPRLVAERAGGTIRLWVPGVSTGEEAYSYAMLLAEEMDRQHVSAEVTIFATDIDAEGIDTARTGTFDPAKLATVPPGRRARHFTADGDLMRIDQRLRDMIVFAVQDVLVDPPFPGLDLVSCRNLLIHLDGAAQPRVLDALAYGLVPGGILVLGPSEAPAERGELFAPVSAEARIYRKSEAVAGAAAGGRAPSRPVAAAGGAGEAARRALLEAFVPPSVVVGRDGAVRHVHGSIGERLGIASDAAAGDIVDLVDRTLREPLRAALERAAVEGRTASVPAGDGAVLTVRPFASDGEGLFLVGIAPSAEAEGSDATLAADLAAARAELQATVEELESANEELKAANEEVMSGNAALHRANLELAASRDELTSANRRLSAANAALESTVAELKRSNGDLATLLSGIDVATLFLDRELAIRRYTPRAQELLGLEPGDVGRRLPDVALAVDDPHLVADVGRVLDRLAPVEREVGAGARWLMRRIVPDRTADHVIAGVLVTAWDVTAMKETANRLARRERQQAAVAALGEAATRAAANIGTLLDAVVAAVAEHLEVPLVKVLELAPGWDTLLLRSGVGWHEGLAGTARVPTDAGSQAGFTLRFGAPVVVENLATETRFSGPSLLTDHGVVSGLSVAIGPTDSPWGVIGAHTIAPRRFTPDDVNFLQAIANIVYATIERQRVARAYRIAAERLELAVGVGGLATWDWDLLTDETVWSESHYTMLGYRKAEVRSTAAAWRARVHPDDLPIAEAAIAGALSGDGYYVCEYRIVPQRGVERWVEGRGRTALDTEGRPVRMFGVVIDITERKRSEERQTLLLNELDHRVRNILANIIALARQTKGRATSVDGYVGDFTDRLAAIGRAHTLLSEARWAGASLQTLLEEEFAAQRRSAQVTVGGPNVIFAPDDTQLFALAFHELAINAVRHGALRSTGGRLTVNWSVEAVGGAEMLAIDWREVGANPVDPPRGQGFGSLVLTRLVPVQTESELSNEYPPEGLHCRILVPRGRVQVAPSRAAPEPAEEAGASASLSGRRVLIVEDSMLTALDIEAMLREEGAEVVAIAGTVEEAEARLARGGIDLALLDRNLAGTMVDGVARALAGASIPFVFMTGYNSQAIPPDLRGAPIINKPFEVETLLAALADVI